MKYPFDLQKLSVLVSVVLLTTSCELIETRPFELPFSGGSPVVYGLMGSDDTLSVSLYETQAVLDYDTLEVPVSGSIQLLEEGQSVLSTEVVANHKKIPFAARQGASYALSVEVGGQTINSAPVLSPRVIPVDTCSLQFDADSTRVVLGITFQDPPEQNDYYTARVLKKYQGEVIEREERSFRNLISDQSFNGSSHTITKSIKLGVWIFDGFELVDRFLADELVVLLYRVSEPVYLFYESLDKNNGEIGNQFSNQTPPYSNLSDGYGFFGTYAVDSMTVRW